MSIEQVKFKDLRVYEAAGGAKELRASFDNERVHGVAIKRPHGARELAEALHVMSEEIMRDPNLNLPAHLQKQSS